MKNKFLKLSVTLIAILALTLSFAACVDVQPQEYTVTYSVGEGVTGSYESASYQKDVTITLPDGTALTKENHVFAGWNDGTANYDAGATYVMGEKNVTFTAVWNEKTYTVTFNGGEGVTGSYDSASHKKDEQITLPDGTALSKENCTFAGWSDGTADYTAGATYVMPANDVTFTAVWKDITYTVSFNGGEGVTGSYDSASYKKDAEVILPDGSALTKDGFEFDGWNDGTTDYLAGALYIMPANNVTFTAVWKEVIDEGDDGEGDDDANDVIKTFIHSGAVIDGNTVTKIAHNETKATITVTYDDGTGEKTVSYDLIDYGDGDWQISGETVFGSGFDYISFSPATPDKCIVNYSTFKSPIIFNIEAASGGSGDDANDELKTFVHDGAEINGHIVTKIVYNKTQSKITVTYDGSQTATYALSDWGDGDWRINETTIFGSLYCITILPVADATTLKVDLSGYGAVDVTFKLEGYEEGGSGDGPVGEDVDKTYEIVAEGPWAVTQVNGNTINKLVYNAAKATIVVTYNDTQTATYNLVVGDPIYDLIEAWTIVEEDHIFTAEFLGIVIDEANIGIYVGSDVLNFAPASSGDDGSGDSGSGGDGGNGGSGSGPVSGAPLYTNAQGVQIGDSLITQIEFNQSNGAILVYYTKGVEPLTETYTISPNADGTWHVNRLNSIFGESFKCIQIDNGELMLIDNDGNVMGSFTLEQ